MSSAPEAARELKNSLDSRQRKWTIEERAQRQLELGKQIKPLEEERKEHSEHIQAHMMAHGLGNKAVIGGVVCQIIPMDGKQWIDKTTLIEKGVGLDVIEAATKKSDDYSQFRTAREKE